MNDDEVARTVLNGGGATDVVLAYSKQKCRGTVVVNAPDALAGAARSFHRSSVLMTLLTIVIVLIGIMGIIFTPIRFVVPYILVLVVGWMTLDMAHKDEATCRAILSAIKSGRPGKYVVVYHTKETLIHELLHIKHDHFNAKGSNITQDRAIEKETKRILREIRCRSQT